MKDERYLFIVGRTSHSLLLLAYNRNHGTRYDDYDDARGNDVEDAVFRFPSITRGGISNFHDGILFLPSNSKGRHEVRYVLSWATRCISLSRHNITHVNRGNFSVAM